jgi:peptidoglycan/xylan/chitin deacetylase (PgdA/CDA1 family)
LPVQVARQGHEIGFHGHRHVFLERHSPASLLKELQFWRAKLADLTGTPILGYRAPYFSVTRRTAWALRCIDQAGFRYDASIYPGPNDRYGWLGAPTVISRIRESNLTVFPVPVLHRVFPIGYSGGAYLRMLPSWLIHTGFDLANRVGQPSMIYVHPWELDEYHERPVHPWDHERPSLAALRSWRSSLTSLPGRKRTRSRLENLLARLSGRVQPMNDVINQLTNIPTWNLRTA